MDKYKTRVYSYKGFKIRSMPPRKRRNMTEQFRYLSSAGIELYFNTVEEAKSYILNTELN